MACNLSAQDILDATGGMLVSGDIKTHIRGVGTDSRENLVGKCFIPLKGDNFDGHDFIESAIINKASIILTHKEIPKTETTVIIQVKDTLLALQDLAQFWRKKINVKVLAISGSNGKTTSKEFAKVILESQFKVTASKASFNNHWGVPLTLLNVNSSDDIAIVEMGMNHLGELKNLSKIAEQDVSVVTTIGHAHVGEVGSFADIVKAKKELYDFSPKALHIFNLDNKETLNIFNQSPATKKLTFSMHDKMADVFLQAQELHFDKVLVKGHINGFESESWVPIFGEYNVYNVMVAACLGLAAGMDSKVIWPQLKKMKGAWGRSDLKTAPEGFKVIFDAYNANPESVLALDSNVRKLNHSGKKYFILGDMLEMGDNSEAIHRQIIETIEPYYDGVWYIGQHAESLASIFNFDEIEKNVFLSSTYEVMLAMKFHSMLHPEDLVLIKGSRGMRLESILEAWKIN